tara:strand:- start:963 stop:3812 length:2850 start_codon:yes stop_codon:yes gene_type:complete
MAVIYGTSEFTDEKGTTWKVNIVDGSISTGDLNYAFTLGPDGFRLSYDYDNFDRCKPILGSKVEITLLHNDALDTQWNNFYNALDSAVEGTYRIEIYRDPDGDNEAWWIGEILPEQVVIPDNMPNAPVSITAADGLANLRGIDYNNAGSPYDGTDLVTEHLYKALSKVHSFSAYGTSSNFIRFFEDFYSYQYKEYLDDVGGVQKQLQNARIEHTTFHNINENGLKEYYSAYRVLESIAITFNSCVFMARGTYWFVPMGAMQQHDQDNLKTYHLIYGNGTVLYNTSENLGNNYLVEFGNNNDYYEKLSGWERSSTPAFKEVTRVRNYQGDLPLLLTSYYNLNSGTGCGVTLSDEDAAQPETRDYIITGRLAFFTSGYNTVSGIDKVVRPRLKFKVRVGDAGGTENYASRVPTYSSDNQSTNVFQGENDTTGQPFRLPQYPDTTWSNTDTNRVHWVGNVFDGSNGNASYPDYISSQFYHGQDFEVIISDLPADADGLEVTACLDFIQWNGDQVTDVDYLDTSVSLYKLQQIRVGVFDNDEMALFGQVDILAKNSDDARYYFDQGETLIGDEITGGALGVISIFGNHLTPGEDPEWQPASHWNNASESSVSGYSINGLGVRERLGANKRAIRTERGTLYRTGNKFIHPYNVLKNVWDSNNYYQITGLNFIANRCEYDIECIFLDRNITGITDVHSGKKPSKGPGQTGQPPGPIGVSKLGIVDTTIQQANLTKTQHITTDSDGITALKYSDGAGTDYAIMAPGLPTNSFSVMLAHTSGTKSYLAPGLMGQVCTIDGSGRPSWADAAGGESGWFNSTTLMKVMPTEFMLNDAVEEHFLQIEDGTSNKISVRINDARSNGVAYAIKAIPTGYKATHVEVHGVNNSGTANPITIRQHDHTDGDLVNTTSGNYNTSIAIIDITSSATANVLIKVELSSHRTAGQDIIYGADITIAAV